MEIRSHDKTFPSPPRTKQSFKDECDINIMLKTYQKTGAMPNINPKVALYGNFSLITDLHTAITQVKDAEQAFMAYPSQLRKRFGNRPENLINFLEDPDNHDEAVELGLVAPEPNPRETPPPTTPTEPAPPGGETTPPPPTVDPTNPEGGGAN